MRVLPLALLVGGACGLLPTATHLPTRQPRYRTPSARLALKESDSGGAPDNWPVLAAAVGAAVTTAVHAPAFASFAQQWQQISAAGVTGDDFSAPLLFWTFFALMHPLLQPAIAIGEVLHGSPGPMLGDIVPISFLVGNVVVLGALARFKQLRAAIGIGALALLINYVGCGLEVRGPH